MSPQKHKKVVQFKQNNDEEREEVDHEHVVDINPHHHGGPHHHRSTNTNHTSLESVVTTGVASLSLSDATKAIDADDAETKGENNNNNNNNNNSNNNFDDDEQLIWFKKEENWELTWPIWHMLPRQERKDMALKYGYKTIGAFEEYMSLKSAVGDSELAQQEQQKPYENQLIYNDNHNNNSSNSNSADIGLQQNQQQPQQQQQQQYGGDDDDQKVSVKEKTDDSDDDDDDDDDEEEDNEDSSSSSASSNSVQVKEQENDHRKNDVSYEELLQDAGLILMLPDELLHSIFEWLPIDVYGTLALLNSHWKSLTRTEFVYKRLCERTYLQQSKRKALHVSRFGNSYRTMLEQRPRVRTGGGVYVLKYAQVKKIQRDMWTEIPVGAVLETVYYRYFYFQEDGRVLYALTSRPPHEMFPRFWKMVIHTNNEDQNDKVAVWGTYQVQKNTVTVNATHPWHSVRMVLTIQSQSIFGKFNALSFDKHCSSASANFDEYWSQDLVEYKVPHEMFQFVKDKRL